jgi:hypothetical protein
MQARYYSSGTGRFGVPDLPLIDQDALYPQSWNLYAYVRNNPLRFVDPSGRACRVAPDGTEYDDDNPGQSCEEVRKADADPNRKPDITVAVDRSGSSAAFDFTGAYIPNSYRPPSAADTALHDESHKVALTLLSPIQAIASELLPEEIQLAMISAGSLQRFAANAKLRNILNSWNRTGRGAGSGSTADAVRHELATGQLVGGKGHVIKALEMRTALTKLLHDKSLSAADRSIVKDLLIDIQDALSTVRGRP